MKIFASAITAMIVLIFSRSALATPLSKVYKQHKAENQSAECRAEIVRKYAAVDKFAAEHGSSVTSIQDGAAKDSVGYRNFPMNSCSTSEFYVQLASGQVCKLMVSLFETMGPGMYGSGQYAAVARGTCE